MRLMTLLTVLALASGAQALDRDSWSGPIAGALVRIDNPYGDIRLRHGGSDGNLEMAAILQQLSIDGSKLAVEVDVTDETAVVRVVRFDFEGNPAPGRPRRDASRVDLAITIPDGSAVRAETTTGLIEARGVRTDLDLRTDSGAIRASENRGAITAYAQSGTTEITLEAGATAQPLNLSSVTGLISVLAAPTNDLDVTMSTSGHFITDFSLEVEHHDHEEPNKVATALVGKGGQDLTITSKRGDIALRRVLTVDLK